jgi:hypothetical protein
MTVYVDDIQTYPAESIKDAQARRVSRQWCHMWTDGDLAELHQVAQRIGLRRAWFQDRPGFPHYDLTPSRRAKALEAGAVAQSLREHLIAHRPAVRPAAAPEPGA